MNGPWDCLSLRLSLTLSFCVASLLIYPSCSVCVWGRWCSKSWCFCVLIFCVAVWCLPVCVAQPQARQACVVFTQQAHGMACSLGHNTCFEGKRRAMNRCRLETLCLSVSVWHLIWVRICLPDIVKHLSKDGPKQSSLKKEKLLGRYKLGLVI